jgi:D-aspartate ligase
MSSRNTVKAMPPVVVVGGTLNALGVVRSLAREGMPIFLVVTTRWRTAAWSRFCHVVRTPTAQGYDLVDALRKLSTRIGQRAVLLLTEDRDVEVVSNFREELEQCYRFSLPSKEMVRTLADKTLFQKFAETEGFPVPRTVILSEPEDLPLLQSVSPPVVIKPNNFQLVSDRGVKRAVRVDSLKQARAVATEMLKSVGGIVVQEWIEGTDSDIFFTLFACDAHSRMMGLFSGRKLTCYPKELGSTAVCSAAGEPGDELAKLSLQFVERVRYKGVGSLEFKRDRKTGRFVIIEPTVGRTDWQEEIATLCGVNIPAIAYWTELGRKFRQEPCELARIAWRSSIEHRPPAGILLPRTRIVDGHFRVADPLPGLYHYGIERFAQPIWMLAERGYRLCAGGVTSGNQPSVVRTKENVR